jgi:hypothetical protein
LASHDVELLDFIFASVGLSMETHMKQNAGFRMAAFICQRPAASSEVAAGAARLQAAPALPR